MENRKSNTASGETPRSGIRVRFSRSFMRKMIASFLLIAIVPLLACLLLSWSNYRAAYQREMLSLNGSVQKSASQLESALSEADELLTMIIRQNDMLNTVTYDGGSAAQKLYSFIQARDFFQMLVNVSGLADNIFILNEGERIAITGDLISMDMDLFGRWLTLRYPGYDWTRAFADISVKNSPTNRTYSLIDHPETGRRAVAYGATYLRKQNKENLKVALLILPEHVLGEVDIDGESDYAVFLNDALLVTDIGDGALLAALTSEEETLKDEDGMRYVASQTVLPSGFRVVGVKPYTAVTASVRPLLKGMLAFVVCVAAVSLFLCFFIAYLNSRPFEKLLAAMFGRDGVSVKRSYGWDAIYESVQKLLLDNLTLRSDFEAQTNTLKSSLIHELLSNRNCNRRSIVNMLTKLGAAVDQPCWTLLIGVGGADKADADLIAQALLLSRLTDRFFQGVIHALSTGTDRYFLILDAAQYDDNRLKAVFSAFHEEAENLLQAELHATAARIPSLLNLHDAYFTQSVLIELQGDEQALTVITGDALPGRAEDVQYPTQLGDSLRSAIREGSREKAFACLDEIEARNHSEGVPANTALHRLRDFLYLDIANALLRQDRAPEALSTQALQDLNALNSTDEYRFYFARLKCILEPVLQAIRESAETDPPRGTRLGAALLDFIRENITDSNLSLAMLADRFQFSESYVSNVVKNETGTGFAAYCEALRMEIACDLIRRGENVQNVAALCGYNSPHSFRRAFKKVNGVTPSQFAGETEE